MAEMTSNVWSDFRMVTEKYLLRSEKEMGCPRQGKLYFNEIMNCLKDGDIQKLASLTTANFNGPIKTIIPAATKTALLKN